MHHGLFVLAWNCLWAKAWRSFVGRVIVSFLYSLQNLGFPDSFVWCWRGREDLGICVCGLLLFSFFWQEWDGMDVCR